MELDTSENRGTHWYGGPDFAVEVVSPHDRTFEKLPFYAKVGTQKLLLIERQPWAVRLFRLQAKQLVEVGQSTLYEPNILASDVIPLSWRLAGKPKSPRIEITHHDGVQRWVLRPDSL
jgi:Uma2 family endonuclease